MSDPFHQHRRLLFAVAYDLLSSVADAEDVLQESWLRWSAVDQAQVREPRAYLVQVVTRQSLNRLRANRTRREDYVGPWLPEPLVAGAQLTAPDPAEQVAQGEQVSLAMLVVLETLSPLERAVFVLREVFGLSVEEVAVATDRSAASVRQLAHRAREHVQARRPRFDHDAAQQRQVTQSFLEACASGDLDRLLALLSPEVVLTSDGGGKRKAALRPILGAAKVARFLLAVYGDPQETSFGFASVNGQVGVLGREDGRAAYVGLLEVVDGRITQVFAVLNPDKLAHLDRPAGAQAPVASAG